MAAPVDRDGVLDAALWERGAIGIEERDGALRVTFPSRAAAEAAAGAIGSIGPIEEADPDVGRGGGRDLLTVRRAGRFAVHPPWLDPPSDSVGVVIDPQESFGSGSHPSTRLALELLGELELDGRHVLDVGCGTGVLGIAAAHLGALVTAIDIDPRAVAATRANAARNHVEHRVAASLAAASQVTGEAAHPFDLAVVNVTIDVHETIAPLGDLGCIIIAGILEGSQARRGAAAYERPISAQVVEGEWAALRL